MTKTNYKINYKGLEITGEAYVDGGSVEILDMSIDALDLLGVCDNNSLATIDQLIVEDYLSREADRAEDYRLGYLDV